MFSHGLPLTTCYLASVVPTVFCGKWVMWIHPLEESHNLLKEMIF